MGPNEQRDSSEPRLTSAARKRLGEELDTLRTRRRELAANVAYDEPTGDSADQADALERAMERDRVDQRIAEIAGLLAEAGAAEPAGDVVAVGTLVVLQFPDGIRQELRVGDIAEADDQTIVITPDSPLGRVLLGRRAGDSVTYTAPDGQTRAELMSVRADRPAEAE